MSTPSRLIWVDSWWRAWFDGTVLPLPVALIVAIVCVFAFVILPSGYFTAYFERKFSADLQARVGPNRSGPRGFFQPISDGFKLLQKDGKAGKTGRGRFWLSVYTVALFSTVAVMPLGSAALLVDSEISVFLPFWSMLILALGGMLLGLSQRTVPGWFGGSRITAQALSGLLPALLCVLSVGVRAGGFSWSKFAAIQGSGPLSWGIFAHPPFALLGFFVFLASGLVFMSLEPFDASVSHGDIQGGVGAHLSGRELAVFILGRFYGFFFWCLITAVIFLGAWNIPVSFRQWLLQIEMERTLYFLELMVLMTKTWLVMLVVVWVARSNPRLRIDQITELTWKVLAPLALVCLVGSTLWMIGGALI